MKRKQLFEFEDLPWFPRLIRSYMQDHLAFMGNLSASAYQDFAVKLKDAMATLGETQLLDMCSGGGGPVRMILRLLNEHGLRATARLSDLYPNNIAYQHLAKETAGLVQGVSLPVDATNVPQELSGFRLIANGFHHFPPQAARQLLADAVAKQRGIAVVEMVSRSGLAFMGIGMGFVLVFLAAPFIRPFRFSRLIFTYLIPAVPLFLLWDGMVSCLRAYSPEELTELVASLDSSEYQWDIGEIHFGPGVATYAIGVPNKSQEHEENPLTSSKPAIDHQLSSGHKRRLV